LASTHEYATLRPVHSGNSSNESVSVPMTGYLTMRSSTGKKAAATYAEIQKRSGGDESAYANHDEDNDEEDERQL